MRLTRRALFLLRKKYALILRRCHALNFAACALLALSAPAAAASLSIPAPGGHAEINNGGVYDTINISGGGTPTLDITKRLTILGPGKSGDILTGAKSAFMRVLGTTLSFGSATATHGGGLLRGDIFLDRGTLQVYGDQKSMPPVTYVVGAGGAADGAINGSGAIRLRPFAIFQSNQVGTEAEPMTTVQLAEASRFQMYDGIWASDVTIDSASMAAISGDVHIENLTLTGSAAHAQATLGDIYLGNVISDSPDDELFAQANIQADEGNVAISGDLTLSKGLTSIIAGKDITIGNGEGSITGLANSMSRPAAM